MPCGAVSFFDTPGEGMNIFINPLSYKGAPALQDKAHRLRDCAPTLQAGCADQQGPHS